MSKWGHFVETSVILDFQNLGMFLFAFIWNNNVVYAFRTNMLEVSARQAATELAGKYSLSMCVYLDVSVTTQSDIWTMAAMPVLR